jgi:integrase
VIERQRARTQLSGNLIFINPFTGRAWCTGEEQRREWQMSLRRVGVRHRPPKELRDTSVSTALAAGANPYWVAQQHGHSLQTMMKDDAGWIPDADKGRNLAAVNAALGAPAAATGSGTDQICPFREFRIKSALAHAKSAKHLINQIHTWSG